MIDRKDTIRLYFTGNGIQPDDVHANDLAEMIRAWSAFITASGERTNPELVSETLRVSITEVGAGSVDLRASTSHHEQLQLAYIKSLELAKTERYDLLSPTERESLKAFIRFNKKYRCTSELWGAGDTDRVLLTLDANVEIPAPAMLQGNTTIYGIVQHVGGKEPNAHLITLDGASVRCSGKRHQIQQLGSRLYTIVGIEGTARWNMSTLEIVSFEIIEILPYRETPLEEALASLRDVVGDTYDNIDPVEYVRMLREDDE